MILTCPSCATRFYLDDSRIAPGGRRVQCDACGEIWKAPGVLSVENQASDVERFEAPMSKPSPLDAPAHDSAPLFAPSPAFGVKKPPPAAAPAIGRLGWAMAILLFVVILGIVLVNEREWIVRVWPASAAIYKAGGLTGAPTPLLHLPHG